MSYLALNTVYSIPDDASSGAVTQAEEFAAGIIDRFIGSGKRIELADVFTTLTDFLEAVKAIEGLTKAQVKGLALALLEGVLRHVDIPFVMEPFETVAENFFLQNLAPAMLDTLLKFWHSESPGLPD